MDNIQEIKNYIVFLKENCKLEITLHTFEEEQLISLSELIAFNIHENSHCVYIKTFPDAHEHCICRQEKIKRKCKNGAFVGTCYAGVYEFVYPIYDGTSEVGFICVSGYKTDQFYSYIKKVSETFNIPFENLKKTIQSLKDEIPDKKYVDTLIHPLVRMLELAYSKLIRNTSKSDYINDVVKYVNRHYAEDITLKDICDALSCSRSSISHTFKKQTGKSFREYLISVRIQSAKSLLRYSKLSITEISHAVGFNDSNYFSFVFKSHTGENPCLYRKKAQL